MIKTSAKIVFFGTEEFSYTSLKGLIEAGYTIAAVITKPDSHKGRGQVLIEPPVKVLAKAHNIPVWQPYKLHEVVEDIQNLGNVTGVLVSYGKIIPQSIIDLFNPGIINVHPSLLPKYRGPSPIETAIKNGDPITGVTIMQLSAEMDAGPIYASISHTLDGTETRPRLYEALADSGTTLLLKTLPHIIDGSLRPTPQDPTQATYCQLLKKEDAELNLAQLTATQAERRIRAYIGFPKSKLVLLGHTCIITKAHVSSTQKTPLDIISQDGAYLCIDELVAPSGRIMKPEAFLHGYKPLR